MSKFLPIFPLKIIAFPGEKVNLHIFEPRYKQMVRECYENGSTFGLPAYIDGKIMDVATELRILSIEKTYPNGEMDIKTLGYAVSKIIKIYNPAPAKLYMGADVEPLHYNFRGDMLLMDLIIEKVIKLLALLQIDKKIPLDDPNFSTFSLGHMVGLNIEQSYQFLCMQNEAERQIYMYNHLKTILPIVEEIEVVRERAKLNGHFKNLLPPI